MKKILILLICLAALVGLVLFFRVPVTPSGPAAPTLARASVELTLPSDFAPVNTRGFLSWLGVRSLGNQARPAIGTEFASITSTGFASSPYQTDASPCRTAAGNIVRPGTVASNFLPLGTLLKITVDGREVPGLFIVEDRMADRFHSRIDIWFASTSQALAFGKRRVEIQIVGYGQPGQNLADVDQAENQPESGTQLSARTVWENSKARLRILADYLATRGTDVNRFDVDCLERQAAELLDNPT